MTDAANLVLVLAWGYGFVVIAWSARRWPDRGPASPLAARVVGAVGLAAVLASLLLPWVEGPATGSGARLVLTGWAGLDPLTVLAVLALAGPIAAYLIAGRRGGEARRSIRVAQASCLLGLLAGNAAIQIASETVTTLGAGGPVGVSGALVVLLSAGLDRPQGGRRAPDGPGTDDGRRSGAVTAPASTPAARRPELRAGGASR